MQRFLQLKQQIHGSRRAAYSGHHNLSPVPETRISSALG